MSYFYNKRSLTPLIAKLVGRFFATPIKHAVLFLGATASFALAQPSSLSVEGSAQTDWLKEARIGAFMHFAPGATNFTKIDAFDVEALAGQLEKMGAKYFVLTLGQNSGWYVAPNAAYDRITGYQPGERCAPVICHSTFTMPFRRKTSD